MIQVSIIITILYSTFLLWLKRGVSRLSINHLNDNSNSNCSVSVIIAARNEEKNIAIVLECLTQQEYPEDKYEIIIANDGSEDGTDIIISNFMEIDNRIKHIKIENPPSNWSPKKWALNQAVAQAKGEILLFTDADCTMKSNWIRSMIKPFKKDSVGLVMGPSPLEKGGGMWSQLMLMDSHGQDALAAGGIARNLPLTCSGRNLAMRQSVFNDVKGYNDIEKYFSGDDDLMLHKIATEGFQITFVLSHDAEVISPPPQSIKAFYDQRLRFASKGKSYFSLPFINPSFKIILTSILITNVLVSFSLGASALTLKICWLIPWLIKMFGDGTLIYTYCKSLNRKFNLPSFLINELWHSFYVTYFGVMGSFIPITWKKRTRNPHVN